MGVLEGGRAYLSIKGKRNNGESVEFEAQVASQKPPEAP